MVAQVRVEFRTDGSIIIGVAWEFIRPPYSDPPLLIAVSGLLGVRRPLFQTRVYAPGPGLS